MTFDQNPPDSGDHDAAPEPMHHHEEPAPAPAAAAENMFSSGEGMVAFGGILVLLVWLIFEVFTDDYSVATLAVVLAIVAAVLPRVNRESVEKIASLPVMMKVTGYLLAITGLTEIIFDIEAGVFDGFLTVLAALVAYAGYAVAFLGARSIET